MNEQGSKRANNDQIADYLQALSKQTNEQMAQKVQAYLDDEGIEIFVDHLEDFYGIEDDDQLGLLAQIMISGFILGKETN